MLDVKRMKVLREVAAERSFSAAAQKLGYTQSYTYFAWRNTKHELTEYFNELAHGPGREYFRPNVWPNTPDILTEYLQHGRRSAFMARRSVADMAAATSLSKR